ncbi:GIY-YIG nuclease family protein [Candidatus Dojkabacteria bacterium]|jgi:group I intron endonuclease|nr:GIY-YIG nuclease family protein [Candidatus Dojkabacteria bacterium]
MENRHSIYRLTSPSGKVYIGQSVDVRKRMRHYKNLLCQGQHKILNALTKYGFENFKLDILHEDRNIDDINLLEEFEIAVHDSVLNGYNIRFGGNNSPLPDSVKLKIGAKNKINTLNYFKDPANRLNRSKKASIENAKRKLNPDYIENCRKGHKSHAIECIDTKEVFRSIREAARHFNVSSGSIIKHLKQDSHYTHVGRHFFRRITFI